MNDQFPISKIACTTFLVLLPFVSISQEAPTERDDWQEIFKKFEAKGTIVVSDERRESKEAFVSDSNRAKQRVSPASTFKIPHALFALDAGAISDEFEAIPWDGTKHSYPQWNSDQNLRSSMRNSVVWVYQEFAKKIGEKGELNYLQKIHYGNEDQTGADPFWVEGNLRISANEQIKFLKKLYRNELPFSENHQRLVKDIMIVEARRDQIIRAKTGWSGTIGWWVGWIEQPTGPIFFALNIDTPNRVEDLPKREGIARAVLSTLNGVEVERSDSE